jgi:hypothetical protein
VELLVILLLQLPGEDVQIGFNAAMIGTLGDHTGSVLNGPSNQNLHGSKTTNGVAAWQAYPACLSTAGL